MIREKMIELYVKNKDVLDVGSVGQTSSYSLWKLYQNWELKSLTGIDLPDSKEVSTKFFGLNNNELSSDTRIIFGDMEYYSFGRIFDVVVAGDVIEHVNNQGLFLSNIHKHLKDNGILVLTTPNSKWITGFLKPNPTHALWHDKYTLTRILKIHGFKISYFRYYYGNKKKYNHLFRLLTFRQAMLVICQKEEQ